MTATSEFLLNEQGHELKTQNIQEELDGSVSQEVMFDIKELFFDAIICTWTLNIAESGNHFVKFELPLLLTDFVRPAVVPRERVVRMWKAMDSSEALIKLQNSSNFQLGNAAMLINKLALVDESDGLVRTIGKLSFVNDENGYIIVHGQVGKTLQVRSKHMRFSIVVLNACLSILNKHLVN